MSNKGPIDQNDQNQKENNPKPSAPTGFITDANFLGTLRQGLKPAGQRVVKKNANNGVEPKVVAPKAVPVATKVAPKNAPAANTVTAPNAVQAAPKTAAPKAAVKKPAAKRPAVKIQVGRPLPKPPVVEVAPAVPAIDYDENFLKVDVAPTVPARSIELPVAAPVVAPVATPVTPVAQVTPPPPPPPPSMPVVKVATPAPTGARPGLLFTAGDLAKNAGKLKKAETNDKSAARAGNVVGEKPAVPAPVTPAFNNNAARGPAAVQPQQPGGLFSELTAKLNKRNGLT
ncbi:MAG: hypothetical protein AB7V32_09010 [Candidatus Berkiella sp.]